MADTVDTIRNLPSPLRRVVEKAYGWFGNKYTAELAFWKSRWHQDGGVFSNSHYRDIMLAMAEETDESFLEGKKVADFGCGPRGSLAWAGCAGIRIGIDVLVDRYADIFAGAMAEHGMVYVKCTESVIPIGSALVDVLFSLNAMDHVDDFHAMSCELLRILKPGGLFIASFNLNEPPAPCEPQSLTEAMLRHSLLSRLKIESCRISAPAENGRMYDPFITGNLQVPGDGERSVMWVRARNAAPE